MMTRSSVAALALGLFGGACTGLFLSQSNAYPCDFQAPEGERDLACAPGDVCTINGVCQRFQYEGPQFEGPPALPVAGGTRTHPLELYGTVERAVPSAWTRGLAWVRVEQDGGNPSFVTLGAFITEPLAVPDDVEGGALYKGPVGPLEGLLAYREDGSAAFYTGDTVHPLFFRDATSTEVSNVVGFRVGALSGGEGRAAVVRAPTGNSAALGELLDPQVGEPKYRFAPLSANQGGTQVLALEDGGTAPAANADVRWAARTALEVGRCSLTPEPLVPVVGGPAGLYYRVSGGGMSASVWRGLSPADEEVFPGSLGSEPVELRHDRTHAVWAVAGKNVLSTWQLTRAPCGDASPRLGRAWNDCTPCPRGLVAFQPVLSGTGPSVEVLCRSGEQGAVSAARVVGSFAADPSKGCLVEPLEPGLPLEALSRASLDHSLGDSVMAGGQDGQLWQGESFSAAQPFYLDRVPLSFGAVAAPDGGVQVLAVASRYLATQLSDNGFAALPLTDLTPSAVEGMYARVAVNDAPGWTVLSSGDLARLERSPDAGVAAPFSLLFGPRLLDARGEPAREPFFAEGLADDDGALKSFLLSADDSLYFAPVPGELVDAPGAAGVLQPVLTPEPSSPLRSLAVERSPLGTDGVSRVRGYLVTARTLYSFGLTGSPPRWSAAPVLLGGGEPLEVWMDHPRGGLGRVGYRNGEVFTLPGGFPLVQALASGVEADRVLDYENLGGWPVALAESGLYLAGWDVGADGTLQNKFPDGGLGKTMQWRKLTLPGGAEPWLGEGGRLQVLRMASRVEGGQLKTPYVLSVFTARGVYEVSTLTRSNALR